MEKTYFQKHGQGGEKKRDTNSMNKAEAHIQSSVKACKHDTSNLQDRLDQLKCE